MRPLAARVMLAVAVLVAVIAGTACSSTPAPTHGKVVALRYDPPYVTHDQVCTYHDPKTFVCYSYMDETHHHDPKWKALVDGFDKNGKARKAWVNVDPEVYAHCVVGDRFRDGLCDPEGYNR